MTKLLSELFRKPFWQSHLIGRRQSISVESKIWFSLPTEPRHYQWCCPSWLWSYHDHQRLLERHRHCHSHLRLQAHTIISLGWWSVEWSVSQPSRSSEESSFLLDVDATSCGHYGFLWGGPSSRSKQGVETLREPCVCHSFDWKEFKIEDFDKRAIA